MGGFVHFLVVAAVVMGIAHTVAKERIFQPLRQRLGGKETWLGYLVSCPFCASHWIAFAIVPLTGAYFVPVVDLGFAPLTWAVRWFLSSILVVVGAAFLRVGFYVVDETQGLLRRREVEVEEETATQRALRLRVEHEEAERRNPH